MNTKQDLRNILERIDRKSYPAYKDTAGSYAFEKYVLSIDHVQGDPFAAPSHLTIRVPGKVAGFSEEHYGPMHRRTALADLLLRTFGRELEHFSRQAKGSGKSGVIQVSRPGQEILPRSGCQIEKNGDVIFRFLVGFPANGRTINSGELSKILFQFLPQCAERSLLFRSYPAGKVQQVLELSDDQKAIREQLKEKNLIAFVADGAILPRQSGVSALPMKGAIPFSSPESFRVTLSLPHKGTLTGMGIPAGVTLIAGGGYHGKSTLLKALEMGVYNHTAGDGREYVITDDSAVKLRAEDGRAICNVDISMFIRNLPNKKDTTCFSTEDASGSTSQAANVVEAMEAGAKVFLIDEDTSATNFMIRDELMQRVISGDSEPIIPFIDRVRPLYDTLGISTILVAGSCGTYFQKADQIIQMKEYQPFDITETAKREAALFPVSENRVPEICGALGSRHLRTTLRLGDRTKCKTFGLDGFSIDHEMIDLRYVEQLCDAEQVALLSHMLKYAAAHLLDGRHTATQILDHMDLLLTQKGMEGFFGGRYLPSGLALPRRQEIAACINRFRRLQ